MPNLTNRGIGLVVILLLLVAGIGAKQTGDQKKKVPAMSSDDFDVAPPATLTVVPTKAPSSRGLARYAPEGCGLSIELPAVPFSSESPVPGLGSIKNYTSVGDGYIIVVSHLAAPGQPHSDGQLDAFAHGLLEGIGSSPGHSNPKFTITDTSPTRASLGGSYDVKEGTIGVEGFVQLEGQQCWVVLAVYPRANTAAVEPSRKVFASARFDGPPCK